MNSELEKPINQAKPKSKPKTDYLRVKKETKKKIVLELANLNRKGFGKSITPDQYIALAISLITAEHLEQLKAQSLSNKDRLDLRYREYCANYGKISMDEYLGILLTEQKI